MLKINFNSKKWACVVFIAYAAVFTLFISSCNRSGEVEEGDRNTYTVKGRLFKGVSDEPYPNMKLELELVYGPSYGGDFETIVETTTDENGEFSLTYRRITKLLPRLFLNMVTTRRKELLNFL